MSRTPAGTGRFSCARLMVHNRSMGTRQSGTEESLYRRLGGYDVIAAVVDDLFLRLRADPRFSRFGVGRSIDSHIRARQLLVDQILALAGGPCFYIGRDMKTSHSGLAITEEEWQANLQHTTDALIKHGIGA